MAEPFFAGRLSGARPCWATQKRSTSSAALIPTSLLVSALIAALARLELRVMFETVLRRLSELRLADFHLTYRAPNFVGGLEGMPVRFSPSARGYV